MLQTLPRHPNTSPSLEIDLVKRRSHAAHGHAMKSCGEEKIIILAYNAGSRARLCNEAHAETEYRCFIQQQFKHRIMICGGQL